jgi:hypothetical protein
LTCQYEVPPRMTPAASGTPTSLVPKLRKSDRALRTLLDCFESYLSA